MQIPLIDLPTVVHIGTLVEADRGRQYPNSMEGSGLSVSLCPNAWAQIAHLGGDPNELHCDGARFVDLHGIKKSTMADISAWAETAGLIESRTIFRGYFYDSEQERWSSSIFASRDKAEQEVLFDFNMDAGDSLEDIVLERRLPRGVRSLVVKETAGMLTRQGLDRTNGFGEDVDASDFAVAFFAEDVLASIDPSIVGVWWRERLDVLDLSAPRGAIFSGAVGSFSKKRLSWTQVDDRILMNKMPRPITQTINTAPERVLTL